MNETEQLSQTVKDLVMNKGAIAAGIATQETLEGGPPSTDLSYVLPGAKSAVCFALALDQEPLERFLKKEDFESHNRDNALTNTLASGIALELSEFLNMKDFESVPVASNFVYCKDTPQPLWDGKAPIAHRYLAVRSGIAHFGLSGNVLHAKEGAAIILGSVVTQAELIPTDPLPPEENYCDQCRLCIASCASSFMSPDEETTVTLGGVDFTYSKRETYHRCDYVCGGFAGLHRSGKWSTWSPARFPIPEKDEDFMPALMQAAEPQAKRPRTVIGFFALGMPDDRGQFTCNHCQLICHPDKKVRQKRYKMLTKGGVVIQHPDGSLQAVSPEEAKKHLAAMTPDMRALYE